MSALRREVLINALPRHQLPPRTESDSGLVTKKKKKDFAPITWKLYFEEEQDIIVGENKFHLYTIGSSGPILLLLHGAGHSALSWAVFARSIQAVCSCQVIAMDFRGHGATSTTDDMAMDANVMAKDVADVLDAYLEDDPPVVILGHSMGGAIAVHIAVKNLIPSLKGLAVIDVVEGTALDALPFMQNFLRSRPQEFECLESAIEWSIRSGHVKNIESAKVSMSGQLKRVVKEVTGPTSSAKSSDVITEESDEEMGNSGNAEKAETMKSSEVYQWRVDLSKTEQYWDGWFRNMSTLFLSSPVPKLLIIAGIDRLDKELTIGQMQGKFQVQVLTHCGHMVHEDVPDQVANALASFLSRQKLLLPKGETKAAVR